MSKEKKIKELPYRNGVGIVVLNDKNEIFVAKRIDNPKNFWQMPQGGVDKDENYYDAALRELKEETSIVSVKLIKEIEKKTNYDKAVSLVKSAKKYEKNGKTEKAKKVYAKAQKLLIKSNEKKPGKADTLNYLGFTTRKLGDFENGEKYYLQGLAVDPKHKGINEYLGELYVATNRHNLAVERLGVLEGCNCEEYDQLKAVIAGEKSKY